MLDDVEGKIVESTKTPHRDQQQQAGPDMRVIGDQKPGGNESGNQKQKSLADDENTVISSPEQPRAELKPESAAATAANDAIRNCLFPSNGVFKGEEIGIRLAHFEITGRLGSGGHDQLRDPGHAGPPLYDSKEHLLAESVIMAPPLADSGIQLCLNPALREAPAVDAE